MNVVLAFNNIIGVWFEFPTMVIKYINPVNDSGQMKNKARLNKQAYGHFLTFIMHFKKNKR